MRRTSMFWVVLFALFMGTYSMAAVPEALHFSGQLDFDDAALTDPDLSMTFTLYTEPTGGDGVWTAVKTVDVQEGRFHIELTGVTHDMLAGGTLFLGIQVENLPEMSPRIQLNSVPFSRLADNALKLDGQDSEFYTNKGANLIQWVDNNSARWTLKDGQSLTNAVLSNTNGPCVEGGECTTFHTTGQTAVYNAQRFIPVDPTRTYYGRIWARCSDCTGNFYAGFDAYDADKNHIQGNTGTYQYFIAGSDSPGDGTWYEGYITGEGNSGADKFPVGTRFIQPIIITNYSSPPPTSAAATDVDAFFIGEVTPLQPGQVGTGALANDAVLSANIKDGEVKAADIAVDAVGINHIDIDGDLELNGFSLTEVGGITFSDTSFPYLSTSGGTLNGNLAMGGNKVTGLAAPTAGGDAATKAYVDAASGGVSFSIKHATCSQLSTNDYASCTATCPSGMKIIHSSVSCHFNGFGPFRVGEGFGDTGATCVKLGAADGGAGDAFQEFRATWFSNTNGKKTVVGTLWCITAN